MESVRCFFFLCAILATVSAAKKQDNGDLKIVCYYSNWAVYRPGLFKFTPQNINPYLCTHLIYAFGGLSKDFELKPFDPYNDIEQGNYKKFVGLKSYNPKLKTMIAVGGWNEGSKRFSQLVSSYTSRQRFARSAVRFLRQHSFDGLDLDWEYPGFRDGASDGDKYGYAQLMRELRDAFDAERVPNEKGRLLLSVAVPAGKEYIDGGFDVPSVAKSVDFMNVLTYDYHTAYESETHHHAPLRARDDFVDWDERKKLNVEWTIDYYLQNGAPKEKIILGIPTYGRSYTLLEPKENDLESPTEGPGEPGSATREKGYLAYYEICQKIKDENWEVVRPHPKISGPYAFGDNQWVGYDDEEMIIEKVRFILDRGLGGAMVWTLDNDDFRGQCGDEQSPLINTIRTALLANNIEGSSNHRTLARAIKDDDDSSEAYITLAPTSAEEEEEEDEEEEEISKPKPKASTRQSSSRRITESKRATKRPTENFRTPAPPPTPDPGPAFECKDEGFFNNPRDCKKYFWCLDSGPANLGIVPHAFTCPSGLHFNSRSESCDYPENVGCKIPSVDAPPVTPAPAKRVKSKVPRTGSRTTTTEEPEIDRELVAKALKKVRKNNPQEEGGEDLSEILRLLKQLGGVQGIQTILDEKKDDKTLVAPTTARATAKPAVRRTAKPTVRPTARPTTRSTAKPTTARQTLPSYVTPRRNLPTEIPTPPTTISPALPTNTGAVRNSQRYRPPYSPVPYKPATLDDSEPTSSPSARGVQFQRRPQFDSPLATTTDGPAVFRYIEPDRARHTTQTPTEKPGFQFVYQTPGRSLHDQDPLEAIPLIPVAPLVPKYPVDDIFSYQTPARPAIPTSTITVPSITYEPEPAPHIVNIDEPKLNEEKPQAYRVPIRVPNESGGDRIRVQNQGRESGGNRRRARVRVKAGVVRSGSNLPRSESDVIESVSQIPGGARVVGVRRRPTQNNLNGYDNQASTLPRSAVLAEPLQEELLVYGGRTTTQASFIEETLLPEYFTTLQPTTQRATTQRTTTQRTTTQRATTQKATQSPSRGSGARRIRPVTYQTPEPKPVELIDDYENDYYFTEPAPTFEPFTTSTARPTVRTTTRASTRGTTRATTSRPSTRAPTTTSSSRRAVSQPSRQRRPTTPSDDTLPSDKISRGSGRAPTVPKATTRAPPVAEELGPAVQIDSNGELECLRRGVFRHPQACGQFVVCAPIKNGNGELQSHGHHCPKDHIFLEGVGRCMRGDKVKCEVF